MKNWGFDEWFWFGAFTTIGGLCIIFVFAVINQPRCLRSHPETVLVPQTTSYVPMGKVWVPVTHPAHMETIAVCDEYEKEQ